MRLILNPVLSVELQLALLALTLTAAAYDTRYRRIPNWLTVTGVLVGVALRVRSSGMPGLWESLLGLGVAFGVYLALYALRAMGAGDVKLMAALGAVAGLRAWFAIFLLTSIAGALLAICLAVSKRRLRTTLWNVGFLVRELAALRAPWLARDQLDVKNPHTLRLPHAVSIAIGTILSLVLMHRLG